MQSVELERRLLALPLGEPVEIDGEAVYLRLADNGAELGVQVLHDVTGEQLEEVLRLGFQLAVDCEAGWALEPDGAVLLLNRWLPGATGWIDAAAALERLLDAVEQVRLLESFGDAPSGLPGNDERRMRARLLEGA